MRTGKQDRAQLVSAARKVVERDAGWHVRRIARLANAALDEALAPTGLSAAQFTLMTLVAANEDDRIGALAERAAIDQSTLSRTLEGLERVGLIEIVRVERDRRRRAVWLTEEGARRLAAAMPLWRSAHDRLEPTFAALDLSRVAAILAPQQGEDI